MEHKGFALWFTGLSGAGKTTIGNMIAERLRASGAKVEILDGDVIRTNLSKGLGFSKEDRDTNIRRIGFVSQLLARNGVVCIVAAISPYKALRDEIRDTVDNFIEVYAACDLDELIRRDIKGLYRMAIDGKIENFTGISDPYEPPDNPEIIFRSDSETPEQSAEKVWNRLIELEMIKP